MKHIRNKLREALNESLLTSNTIEVYVNGTKYNCYHGRIDSKRMPSGQIITERRQLLKESIEIFKD